MIFIPQRNNGRSRESTQYFDKKVVLLHPDSDEPCLTDFGMFKGIAGNDKIRSPLYSND